MPTILAYLLGEIGAIYFKKAIYIALITSAVIALVAMWGSFIVAFFYFIEKVQFLFNFVTTGTGVAGGSIDKFLGLLNCIGFTSAFNDTKSVWLSGITFIIGRIMYVQTWVAYNSFLGLLKPLLTR